jgi:glycosyltransferase involved in cell wall biosynthesis
VKITILSDSPFIPTGYRNQSVQLAKILKERGHEIHYLANAYNGTVIDYAKLFDGTELDFKIYGEMGHQYFRGVMSSHLKKTNSEVFFILLDTFMLFPWFLQTDTSPSRTIFWYPSDGGAGMPKGCENIIRKIDIPVAMSRFGQKQVKDYYNIQTKHIPHGTEPDRFYRLPDDQRNELRKKWGIGDKFVIGVVARNQPRKNLDRTFKTMAILKDRIPNAVLLLHLDPNDPANQVFQVKSLIVRYNLENRVIFTGMKAHEGFDWNEMNNVYNLMDVFFLSTSGEGFGIPIIEAMSCKVPVLATDYTTTQELVKDNQAGLGIKLSGTEQANLFELDSRDYDLKMMSGTMTGGWEVERGFCDILDAADKLDFLYKNPEKAREFGENGRKAVLEKYDFKNVVGPKWVELIEGLST